MPAAMTKPLLFPCPFCGGEADMGNAKGGYFVNCIECLAATNLLMPDLGVTAQAAADQWNTRTEQLVDAGVPGVLIIECDRPLPQNQRAILQHALHACLPPTHKALVLEQGMKVARPDDARLARIEATLGRLITALADETDPDADTDPAASLDGGKTAARPVAHL